MRQDVRTPFDTALERARVAAYEEGEFVGQESFMTAREIRALAVAAGVGPGVSVLDVCCGVAGPGRFLVHELGCSYLGMDSSPSAVSLARERAAGLPCAFVVGTAPPLPAGAFDVVLLLETMLAFADKGALVHAVAAALRPGGRFAFTLEEGAPLTAAERAALWSSHEATAPRTVRSPTRWSAPSSRTPARSPSTSEAARSTTCSPHTASGSTGSTPGASASSPSWQLRLAPCQRGSAWRSLSR